MPTQHAPTSAVQSTPTMQPTPTMKFILAVTAYINSTAYALPAYSHIKVVLNSVAEFESDFKGAGKIES